MRSRVLRERDPSSDEEVYVCPIPGCESYTRHASVLRKHYADWHTKAPGEYPGYRRDLDGEGVGRDFVRGVEHMRNVQLVDRKIRRRHLSRTTRDMRRAGISRQRAAEMIYLAGLAGEDDEG